MQRRQLVHSGGGVQSPYKDSAYAEVLRGGFAPMNYLEQAGRAEDARTILAAVGRLGMALPGELPALPPLRFIEAGLRMETPPLADVQLAAFMLGGEGTVRTKVAHGIAGVIGMAGGFGHLTRAARAYVQARYGHRYYQPSHLSPWLWGDVLKRLLYEHEPIPDEAYIRMTQFYLRSYEASARRMSSTDQGVRRMAAMYALITREGEDREVVDKVVRILDARQQGLTTSQRGEEAVALLAGKIRKGIYAFADDGAPRLAVHHRFTRDERIAVYESSKRYHAMVTAAPTYVASTIDTIVDAIHNLQATPDDYERLADAWAAVIERCTVDDEQKADFVRIRSDKYARLSFYLGAYINRQRQQLAQGAVSVSVARLVADGAREDSKFLLPEVSELVPLLDEAAFAWYGRRVIRSADGADTAAAEQLCTAVREAYVYARSQSRGLYNAKLATARQQRLAMVAVSPQRLRALPEHVQTLLAAVKKTRSP